VKGKARMSAPRRSMARVPVDSWTTPAAKSRLDLNAACAAK
jgi:hypothetical protein